MEQESMDYSDSDLNSELEQLRKMVSKTQKTLNIAVIGLHGCGKSSFLNTVLAVLRGEYHENALVGNFEEEGGHVTRRLSRYPKAIYLDKRSAEDITLNWPTFLDMTGFQNADDGNIRKTLDYIINGLLKDGTKLSTESQNQRDWMDHLQQLYYGDEISGKVDRVIFVASARSKELPCELIRALISQTMDGRRDVPIFGVLTHADKVEEKDTDFEQRFKSCLGLNDLRFLLCSNYCDDIPPQQQRDPRIEIPIARFLQQVINPARHVFQENPDKVEYIRRLINVKLKVIVELLLFLIMFHCVFSVFAPECKSLHIIFIFAVVIILTKFALWLCLTGWRRNLNLRIGTLLRDH